MIVLIDYKMGNLKSVFNAFLSLGEQVKISSKPEDIVNADKVILPGVGAFGDAVLELENRSLVAPIKEFISAGKPFLGICLGLQLLFEGSDEAEGVNGLGVIPGRIKKFDFTSLAENEKIPHMGWNSVQIKKLNCPFLTGIKNDEYFYFVHSYYADYDCKAMAAITKYGYDFASIVWKENVFATQFHPEKSQDIGLRILRNFVEY